jgi:hypothetical protein
MYFDLDHDSTWLESWGRKPGTVPACKKLLRQLVEAAPTLIPLFGHRYLLGEPHRAGNPVLSVYQADIIFYGTDLRRWLLLEFAGLLGLGSDYGDRYQEANAGNPHDPNTIRFWGEFLG